MLTLREMPVQERPRERLNRDGAKALPDSLLLAIILGSGVKNHDVLKVCSHLLPVLDEEWNNLQCSSLQKLPGIGEAKASLLVAAMEFARRRIRPCGSKIKEAADVFALIRHLADRHQEHFICISLNGAHEVIATRVVTIGLVNATQVHPREVFSDAILDRACSIVVAHNHPSGNVTPSEDDRQVTKVLYAAGKTLGIEVLDHLVFSRDIFYSFSEHGEI